VNLKKVIKKKETATLELKPSLSQIDDIVETVAAFSNTRGGIIAVGIANNGRSVYYIFR
jgi:predicted HTH transcriptional regulator